MTDIVAIEARITELNNLIDELSKERTALLAERQAYTNEGIKSYDNFDDIVWETKAVTGYTNFLSKWLGRREAGWKDVLVSGKLYNRTNPSHQPDWLAIGSKGVIDVANPEFWVYPVDGEVFLSDQEALNQRAREYSGGLRKSLETWRHRRESRSMRKAYLETHSDPKHAYKQRNPSSLSQFGNE